MCFLLLAATHVIAAQLYRTSARSAPSLLRTCRCLRPTPHRLPRILPQLYTCRAWGQPPVSLKSTVALAQQVYIPAQGPVSRPQCNAESSYAHATPTYTFGEFSFTQTETVRTATPLPSPTTTATYALPYESLSHLVSSMTTTTWGNWDPNATVKATDTADPYGNAAWSAIWERANLPNFTYRGLYSSTVSPTPVPTSELVYPPPDYFGPQDCYYFPEDFMFGVAGSASQIEGAIADEGRTPVLMETFSSGARDYVANENYYLYKQDIERLASIGVKYYSFSIPWTRIMPFVFEGTPINKHGIDHYDDLINFVLEKGMVPTVTLLHFDTPLQFYGNMSEAGGKGLIGNTDGAYGNETFEDAFVNYGKIVMTHYADRVPVWFTFNEPILYSSNGKSINGVVKAHARLYHFYHDVINGTGKVGLKFNDNFGVPQDPQDASHVEAANHFNSFQIGTFANPINLGIDYPESFKQTIPDYVPLTAEDLAYINGTADFVGLDPYTATVITPPPNGIAACAANTSDPLFPYCVQQLTNTTTGWAIGYRSQSYAYITPTYLRTYLNWVWNTFRSPVLITEFGFPVFDEAQRELPDQLFDSPRSAYYQSFMSEVLKSIWEDGVHVLGAFAWSFADNWEFGDYDSHFGIQTVNRTTQQRRYKKSFFDLVDFVQARTAPGRG
ncbi:glycoside hydrolase family 1 protein [Aplosporella prunicola CBS 121167]|uniref:Glycoside hydrolase family 1 protein n=1 Tax=Aplosporella prunicola CBS 121167 TaxID=1176127 RepID=A0A6A6B1Y4_9PEZI|nr:glycoside hydrolase family 1 protein [Aplosporella prunicola CBS 121167]KAF2137027.1 glycoside hydrolase family 1 protein [Aplosporella prunicola CBS 121167]